MKIKMCDSFEPPVNLSAIIQSVFVRDWLWRAAGARRSKNAEFYGWDINNLNSSEHITIKAKNKKKQKKNMYKILLDNHYDEDQPKNPGIKCKMTLQFTIRNKMYFCIGD